MNNRVRKSDLLSELVHIDPFSHEDRERNLTALLYDALINHFVATSIIVRA